MRGVLLPSALSALLFAASFPPFDFGWAAFAALVPLLVAADRGGRPFLLDWAAGWAPFTGVVWWVYHAMAHYGGIPWFLAAPLTLLLTGVMA